MTDQNIKFSLTADDRTRSAFQSVRSNIEGVAKSLRSATTLGGGVLGAVALGEVRQMGTALLDARIKAEKLGTTLSQAVGAAGVGRELAFVRTEVSRLGLEFGSTAASYAKFAAASRGTALEGTATRDIFTGIAQASTALGLSAEETSGALTAVQQIISKGKVSAEELRGQLGERLPGAFQIAARSIGVTTQQLDKMLQSGELLAEDFLPKFARQLQIEFAGAAAQAAASTQASVNKLETAWGDLKRTLGEGIAGDTLKAGIDKTTEALSNMEKATRRLEKSSGTWLENLREILVVLPGAGGRALEALAGQIPAADQRARLSETQDAILGRRAREIGPRVTADTVAGLRRMDAGQSAQLNAQANEDLRKLMAGLRSPQQRLDAEVAELRRLGGLTGTDVSGAIAEARRRAAGATIDMAKAYAELDAQIRQADLDDRLAMEAKAAEAASDALREYVGLLGQIAGNEREGAERALTPDVSGWQKVADAIREIRGFDAASKTRDSALTNAKTMFDNGDLDPSEYARVIERIAPMPRLTDETKEATDAARDLGLTFTSAFEEAVIGGKKLSDVLKGLGQDVARVLLRRTVTEPLANSLTGALSSLFGGRSGSTGNDIFRGMPFVPFAGGGVMTSGGPLPLRRYAGGGVANSPQLAIFGEGARPEAFVPLPDGRSIPVRMQGGKAAGVSIVNQFANGMTPMDVANAAHIAAAQAKREILESMSRRGAFARG